MKLSVVVPTYNRKDILLACIESILMQDSHDYEVIIVDDGSTDGTSTFLSSKYGTESRLKVLSLEVNKGVNYARNRGVDSAKGEYILFLDSDDQMVTGGLRKVLKVISEGAANHYLFLVSDRQNDSTLPTSPKLFFYNDWVQGKVVGDFIHVLKRDILTDHRFFEQFRAFESLNWFRIAKSQSHQLFSPIVVSIRDRDRNDSLTKGYVLVDRTKMEQQYIAKELMIKLYGSDFSVIAPSSYNEMVFKNIILGMALGKYEENKSAIPLLINFSPLKLSVIKFLNSAKLGSLVRFSVSLKRVLSSTVFKKRM